MKSSKPWIRTLALALAVVVIAGLVMPPAAYAKAKSGGKWIEVDLSRQRMAARQGNKIIKAFPISTGTRRTPTPKGTFRIYAKYRRVRMRGPGYNLPNVPHTMYFYGSYGIHGTYWHNNFGTPMSHGCINLSRKNAAWLYKWAPKGTKVKIHR